MKLIDRLVLKEVAPMFFIGVAMFFSLWFAGGPVVLAIKLLGKGFSALAILKVIGWSIPPVLALTFPMGMLLAVLLGFGRLSADSEAVALFAGGVSFMRTVAAAMVFGVIASGIGFYLNDQVAAMANKRLAEIKDNLPENLPETTHPFDFSDRYSDDALRTLVHIEKGFDLNKKELRQVTIIVYQPDGKTPVWMFSAERATWRIGKSWRLKNVTMNDLGPSSSRTQLDHLDFVLNRSIAGISLAERDPDDLTIRELHTLIGELKAGGSDDSSDLRGAEIALWSKVALPLATLVFAMLGAPLGLRPQRTSKFTGWILAVLIIFAYYVLYTVMSSIARSTAFPPMLAVFLPNIIGCVIGGYLIWKRSQA